MARRARRQRANAHEIESPEAEGPALVGLTGDLSRGARPPRTPRSRWTPPGGSANPQPRWYTFSPLPGTLLSRCLHQRLLGQRGQRGGVWPHDQGVHDGYVETVLLLAEVGTLSERLAASYQQILVNNRTFTSCRLNPVNLIDPLGTTAISPGPNRGWGCQRCLRIVLAYNRTNLKEAIGVCAKNGYCPAPPNDACPDDPGNERCIALGALVGFAYGQSGSDIAEVFIIPDGPCARACRVAGCQ